MRLRFLFLPAFALTLAPACRTTETKLAPAPSEAAPTVVATNPEPAALAVQDERAEIELRRDRAQFLAAEYKRQGGGYKS